MSLKSVNEESIIKSNSNNQNTTQDSVDFQNRVPLGKALFRLMRVIMHNPNPIEELEALPLAQLRLLWTVRFSPDTTMKDFSERLDVSQSTITQLAERLIKRGLIERFHDEQDRRVVRLRMSILGMELLGKTEKQRHETEVAIWNALNEQQREKVLQGLDIFSSIAENVLKEQGHPLPPLPELKPFHTSATTQEGINNQPIADLLSRRVRGNS